MRYKWGMTVASLLLATTALAEDDDDKAWSIEAELEVGVESILSAEDPAQEVTDTFVSIEVGAELALGDRVTAFSTLNIESVTDAETDRAFEDLGLYLSELGLSVDLDPVTLSFGKLSPAFGSAHDSAPGYFGAGFAEDYELEEMIGAVVELALDDATLSFAAFYPDTTALSDSWGERRGRTALEDGGVGNTGKLNNFALQYDREWDNTTLHVGLRHLNQGLEDRAENAAALGMSHAFDAVTVVGEFAHFDGWEGSTASADIATLGAALALGDVTYSATLAQRKITDAPTDTLVSIGVDYEFDHGAVLSAGLARITEEDEVTDAFAITYTLPLSR